MVISVLFREAVRASAGCPGLGQSEASVYNCTEFQKFKGHGVRREGGWGGMGAGEDPAQEASSIS